MSSSASWLRYGMRSTRVQDLQRQLKALGYFKGPTTGYFGKLTQAAVKRFERAHGYRLVDGVAGDTVQRVAAKEYRKLLNGEAPRPGRHTGTAGQNGHTPAQVPPRDPGSIRETGRVTLPGGIGALTYEKAAALVRQNGGRVNPNGQPTVLALRTGNAATSSYRDVFVVLRPGGRLSVFQGTTRPTSSGAGRAMLEPGNYSLSPRWRDGKFNNDAFLVKSAGGSMTVGVDRDVNGDGRWSSSERARNDSSAQIRLHRGGQNTTSSTGCLNVRNYDAFLRSLGGRDARFNLSLVEL